MKKLLNRLLFGGLVNAGWPAQLGLLLLRVTTGLFLAVGHGWDKIKDPSAFISTAIEGNFAYPAISGWFALLGEFLGGILLALGLATRLAALWIVAVFAGAAVVSHGESFGSLADFFLPNGSGEKPAVEPALLYLVIGLCFVFTGSGKTGIDRTLRKA